MDWNDFHYFQGSGVWRPVALEAWRWEGKMGGKGEKGGAGGSIQALPASKGHGGGREWGGVVEGTRRRGSGAGDINTKSGRI